MNRRTVLRVSALALGALPGRPFAQGTSLKEIVVGTWLISSTFDQCADGKNLNPWGDDMNGSFTFDSNGWFTRIFIGETQPAMKSDDPRRADALALAFHRDLLRERRRQSHFSSEPTSHEFDKGSCRTEVDRHRSQCRRDDPGRRDAA